MNVSVVRGYILAAAALILSEVLFSQDYTYTDYLCDQKILKTNTRLINESKLDSVRLSLPDYKNRLGFNYFQYKALLANLDSDSCQYKYLDSAFMRGMTPLCLGKHLKKFDSVYVLTSYKKNYLKAFDQNLINLIDSIHREDQIYRQQLSAQRGLPAEPQKKANAIQDGPKMLPLKKQTKKEIMDSLSRLQVLTDSLNFATLNNIIIKYGWPGAKMVGVYYCERPAADVTILVKHLGIHKRDYQITTLRHVIELCKRQEESWANASTLLFNLHTRFRREFSEFSFLSIEDNHIMKEESFFSIQTMVGIMMDKSSDKIQIKCKKQLLYTELKEAMLAANDSGLDQVQVKARKRLGLPLPESLDESSFEFIESPTLDDNVILYRMIQK